jgi:Fe-S-cluster-containing hydrogenase component 2
VAVGLITYYGYSDGSGEYYVIVDSDKCIGCGKCIIKCPESALELETIFIDFEDKFVVSVREAHRRKLKYTCSSCMSKGNNTPCVLACECNAIKCMWNSN